MSQLSDKILSYAPQQYFTNEEPYVNTQLKNYGTAVNTVAWGPTGTAPTFNSTGGPAGGAGCWQFSINSASEQALRSFGNTSTAAAPYAVTMDNDYSAGGWFRIPTQATGNVESIVDIVRFGGTAHGTTVSLIPSGANVGKLSISNPPLTTTTRYDDGLWHYYADRVFSNGTSFTKEKYIDGVLIQTGTITTASTLWYLNMADNFVNNLMTTPSFVEIAHVYIAPSSAIDATAISEIWSAGITAPSTRTVKYFNGINWVDSSAQKVWNGTAWVDWTAQRYDGSNWVVV